MKNYVKNKKAKLFFALLLALVVAFTACGEAVSEQETSSQEGLHDGGTTSATGSSVQGTGLISEEDLDASWSEAEATLINLNGGNAEINGKGATVQNSTVTINSAGTYVLSGSLDDGQIFINAGEDDIVRLVLNNAQITSMQSSAIYCAQAGKLMIILADGTQNILTDAESYVYSDEENSEPNSAIFSKSDLTVNGTGSLTVNANYHNGITSKDSVVIVSGKINITAPNHGIRGKDSITAGEPLLNIISGSDGMQSDNTADANKGFIRLIDGEYIINAGHDGIQAETLLEIYGGSYEINTGGANNTESSSESFKALKSAEEIIIHDGSFIIEAEDDAIHANKKITVNNGNFTLSSADDGIHADEELIINDGNIEIIKSYEGLEATLITINGGNINITASDDGINASDGSSEGGMFGGRGGQGAPGVANENVLLTISGGIIIINAGGDGIDSNGNVLMTGGELYSSGMLQGPDSAIDYDGTFTLEGGLIAATGTTEMAQTPGESSTQACIGIYFESVQKESTEVKLCDSTGAGVVEYTAPKQFQTLVLSAPEMKQGETYALYLNNELLFEIELAAVVNYVDSSGEEISGVFGGFGGGRGAMGGDRQNGMQPPEGMELPDDFQFPDLDMQGGKDFANRERPDDMQFPEDMQFPDGMPPDGEQAERPDDASFNSGKGRKEA